MIRPEWVFDDAGNPIQVVCEQMTFVFSEPVTIYYKAFVANLKANVFSAEESII